MFPLKSLKGFKCIYNECEKRSSLPTIEQKYSSLTNTNTTKILPSPPSSFIHRSYSSKIIQLKPILPSSRDQSEQPKHQNLSTNRRLSLDNTNFICKSDTFQRSRTNNENLKRTKLIYEQQNKFNQREKTRLSLKRQKSVGRISKSSTRHKSDQSIQT